MDRNEKVYVIGNIEKFWVQVKKVKTGEIGFVPSQILDWIPNIYLKYISNIWEFEIRSVILIFFSKNFFHSYERARRVGHAYRSLRSQKPGK